MKKPIDIPARIIESGWPALIALLFASAAAIALSATGPIGVGLGAVLASAIMVTYIAHSTKNHGLAGRGARVSADGIGATFEGEILWTLPWANFGGYRVIKASEWTRVMHPDQCGVEILDRQGLVVGQLNIEPERFDLTSDHIYPGATRSIFWRVVDRNVPEGGARQARSEKTYSSSPGKVVLQALFGFASFAGGIAFARAFNNAQALAVNDSTVFANPLFIVGFALMLPVGAITLLASFRGLSFLKFPKLYKQLTRKSSKKRIETPAPLEGSRYEDFLIEHGGAPDPPELENGIRYVQVDPEFRISRGHESKEAFKLLYGLVGFYGLAALGAGVKDPVKNLAAFFVFIVCMLGIVALAQAAKKLDRRMLALRDTIVPVDNGLIVIKPDGSHFSFSPKAKRKLFRGDRSVALLEKWTEGKNRYVLDRTHLIRASVQLDHEELKNLEQELPN